MYVKTVYMMRIGKKEREQTRNTKEQSYAFF